MGDHILTLATDGVGTKLLVAEALNKWDTVGIDCMAMNVNDTICVGGGADSLRRLHGDRRAPAGDSRQIGKGLNIAAEMANVVLVSGEVAVLPEMVGGSISPAPPSAFWTRARWSPGRRSRRDVIIGMRSSGSPSNGMTLARKVLSSAGISLHDQVDSLDGSVGMELLTPTYIYVRDVLKVVDAVKVTGIVDVTGGGLKGLRASEEGVRCHHRPIEPQPIFRAIQRIGGVTDLEMYKTFNMGMGYGIVLRPEGVEEALVHAQGQGRSGGRGGQGVRLRDPPDQGPLRYLLVRRVGKPTTASAAPGR